ncbi:MAG: hypothetical protein AB8G05_00375 [Oligoflexales bacterium]
MENYEEGIQDNNPSQACHADIDDNKHYVEGADCEGKSTGDGLLQKRTANFQLVTLFGILLVMSRN